MRTKQEVINFLESKVGGGVECKGNPSLNSQCVTLIKSLMDFLGIKDPYKARGHARDCINTYLSEGIADKGTGFISVFSNKEMGDGYGHIWCNVGEGDGVYYESNGQKALTVTKGKTYSYDNVCNFDKYIKVTESTDTPENTLYEYLGVSNEQEAKNKLKEHLGEDNGKCSWGGNDNAGFLGSERKKVKDLTANITGLTEERNSIRGKHNALIQYIFTKTNPLKPLIYQSEDSAKAEIVALVKNIDILNNEISKNKNKAEAKEQELVHNNDVLQGQLEKLQEQFDKLKIDHAQELKIMQDRIDNIQSQINTNSQQQAQNDAFKSFWVNLLNRLKGKK